MKEIQDTIQEWVLTLLMDQESIVKRALLPGMPQLCAFFGRQKASDIVLSHMITYLNDKDWMLRRYLPWFLKYIDSLPET